jgi:hypothetical protein
MKLKEHGINPELVLELNNTFQPSTAAAMAAHVAAPPLPAPRPPVPNRPRRQAALGVAAVVDRAKEDIKDAEIATVPVSRRASRLKASAAVPPPPPAVPELGPEETAQRSASGSGDSVSLSALMEAVRTGSGAQQWGHDAGVAAAVQNAALPAGLSADAMGQSMVALEALLAAHQAQRAQQAHAAVAAMAAAAAGPAPGGDSHSALLAALSSAFTTVPPQSLSGYMQAPQDSLAAMARMSGLSLWNQAPSQAATQKQVAAAPSALLPRPPPTSAPAPAPASLDTAGTERLNGAIMGLASLLKQANMPSAGWGNAYR